MSSLSLGPGDSKSSDDAELSFLRTDGADRRHALKALTALAGGALALTALPVEAKDLSDVPPPRRALTGRDETGKSVFKSFDVTSKVVEIDANPGLTFYEIYMTEGVPQLTGLEPDPPPAKGDESLPWSGRHDVSAYL